MNRNDVVDELFRMRDPSYAVFQAKLIPTVAADRIIGVRTPDIRRFSKVLYRDKAAECFLRSLPHRYFEENQLHSFLISQERDFEACIKEVESFLPFVDNWATCDQLLPNAFQREPEKLLPYIRQWIRADHTYTVRFGIGMLMQHFLDGRFRMEYADMAAGIRSEEYYVNMMIAWYFATALAKQYDSILPFLEEKRLSDWTHNKTIQKCLESYRITNEQKAYLRTLKVRKTGIEQN